MDFFLQAEPSLDDPAFRNALIDLGHSEAVPGGSSWGCLVMGPVLAGAAFFVTDVRNWSLPAWIAAVLIAGGPQALWPEIIRDRKAARQFAAYRGLEHSYSDYNVMRADVRRLHHRTAPDPHNPRESYSLWQIEWQAQVDGTEHRGFSPYLPPDAEGLGPGNTVWVAISNAGRPALFLGVDG